jgi:hypothetical protein
MNLYAKNVNEMWYGVEVLIFLVIKKTEYWIYTHYDHRQTFTYISESIKVLLQLGFSLDIPYNSAGYILYLKVAWWKA